MRRANRIARTRPNCKHRCERERRNVEPLRRRLLTTWQIRIANQIRALRPKPGEGVKISGLCYRDRHAALRVDDAIQTLSVQ